ncbi:MAG: PD40 domain-containing protein [Solirubrobacterales bacterium]|nr:PD40 domain-containing protein [Solirubrobacterales bacterium]
MKPEGEVSMVRHLLAVLGVAVLSLAFATSASATLPGKNGPLLVSAFTDGGINGSTTRIFTENLVGKSTELLGALDHSYSDPAVSPNGRQIVYSAYPGYQLWLGPFSRPTKAKAITAEESDVLNQDSVFSPDGKSIYFSKKYYLDSGVFWHLKRYTIKTKQVKSYKVDTKRDWGLTDVSPNGRFVSYNRGGDEDTSKIRLLDTKTGKSHTVNTKGPALDPHFSPDGKWIAYTAPVGDAWEVFRARLDGKGAKRLTRSEAINFAPTYSPNGKMIAFTQGADEDKRIGIITLKTGKVKYLKAPGRYAEVEQWLRK